MGVVRATYAIVAAVAEWGLNSKDRLQGRCAAARPWELKDTVFPGPDKGKMVPLAVRQPNSSVSATDSQSCHTPQTGDFADSDIPDRDELLVRHVACRLLSDQNPASPLNSQSVTSLLLCSCHCSVPSTDMASAPCFLPSLWFLHSAFLASLLFSLPFPQW